MTVSYLLLPYQSYSYLIICHNISIPTTHAYKCKHTYTLRIWQSKTLGTNTYMCTSKWMYVHKKYTMIKKWISLPINKYTINQAYIYINWYIYIIFRVHSKAIGNYYLMHHEWTLTMMPVFAVRNMGMKNSLWHVNMKFAYIFSFSRLWQD